MYWEFRGDLLGSNCCWLGVVDDVRVAVLPLLLCVDAVGVIEDEDEDDDDDIGVSESGGGVGEHDDPTDDTSGEKMIKIRILKFN